MKRTIAFILTICMVITCFSSAVTAKEVNTTVSTNSTATTKDDDSYDKDTSDSEKPDQEYSNNDEEDKDISTSSSDTIDSINYPEFNPEPVIIDGVTINVFAPEGVFPKGANLRVSKISDESQLEVDNAIDKVNDDTRKTAKSYTYDIKIIDKDGKTELEPKDSKKVHVSFTTPEVADVNLDTEVYHVTEVDKTDEANKSANTTYSKNSTDSDKSKDSNNSSEHKKELKAEKLKVIEEADIIESASNDSTLIRDAIKDENTAVVETDSFSYYTVNFTYESKYYYLYGVNKISVDDIRDRVELLGEVTNAVSSDGESLKVTSEGGKYYIEPVGVLNHNVTLTITINGNSYEIAIKQAAKFDSSIHNVTSWGALQDKVNNCADGDIIQLGQDITASGSNTRIKVNEDSNKKVIIDLNGHTLNRNRTSSDGNGHVIEVWKGTLTIRDTSGDNSGKITGGYAKNGGGINIHKDATVIIESGTIYNNKAGSDGGGIFNRGYLKMTGGVISGNHADDTAGAIYCSKDDKSHFDIENVVITQNDAKNKGGAFNIHLYGNSSLNKCNINNNKSKSDYAGAIYMDASGKTLTITDCNINNNKSDDDAGAIFLQAGIINMTGGKVNFNKSDNDSGAVKVTENTSFTATGTVLSNNNAVSEEAGAIKNFGTTNLNNCTINNNTAAKEGGALWNDSKMTIVGGTLNGNYSALKGGAIYSDSELSLNGGTIENNSTTGNGGGIFVGGDSKPVSIQGYLVVRNNIANNDSNVYLRDGRKLNKVGDFTEYTEIWLTLEKVTGTAVTSYGIEDAPTKYFHSDNGYGIRKNGNTVEVFSGWEYIQKELNQVPDGGIVKLDADYKAAKGDKQLKVNNGSPKNITLDLNGHTLDRARTSSDSDGHVMEVYSGTLTIIDSSDSKKGTITGGYATNGGGINIQENATVIIENANIVGNRAEDGGGILNRGTLTIQGNTGSSVVIQDNSASSDGGGIHCCDTGSMSLQYADIILNNSKDDGGGIYIAGLTANSTISNCHISQNISSDCGGGIGMFAKNKRLTITDSHIDNNSSSDDGGGIYLDNNDGNNIELISCHVDGNQTENDSGAVKVEEKCKLTATSSSFSDNKAQGEEGGGIKNLGTTELIGCVVVNNSAKKEGGGIFNGKSLTINTCEIKNNKSSKNGGGIYNNGGMTITTTESGKNTIFENIASAGGGIYIDKSSSQSRISGSISLTSNNASAGGDVYINNSGNSNTLQLDNSFEPGNDAIVIDAADRSKELTSEKSLADTEPFKAPAGMDVALNNQHIIIVTNNNRWKQLQAEIAANTGSVITLDKDYTATSDDTLLQITNNHPITIDLNGHTINRALNSKKDQGKVFDIAEHATLTIKDSSNNNSGVITGGYDKKCGAIMIQENGTLNFEGGTISGNKAGVDGGAIYVKGTLNMTGGVLTKNKAEDTGGAIYCTDKGKIDLKNVTISNNSSDNTGGGLNLHMRENSSITNCVITGNESDEYGGAIRVDEKNKTLTIDNTTIENNSSGDDGGAIYLYRGKVEMNGGSVNNNTSFYDSGAVKVTSDTTFTATDATFNNNAAVSEEAGAIKSSGDTTLTNCDISNNTAAKAGGGIYVYDEVTINNCTINNNVASRRGGGIQNLGKLTINGATITGNKSTTSAGGVAFEDETLKMQGVVIIKDNTVNGKPSNCRTSYNYSFDRIDVIGDLTGSEIWIDSTSTEENRITNNYSKHNTQDPKNIFKSDAGYNVVKKNDEVYLTSSWSNLEKTIKNAKSGNVIYIEHDYAALEDDGPLTVSGGKNITVDLQGYTLNRNMSDSDSKGHVFRVIDGSTLTITDSSQEKSGRITGGYANNGGAINIDGKSTVKFEAGTITGNEAEDDGGAVYVHKGTFEMTGGTITGNNSERGAAIFLDGADQAVLKLSGGTIMTNTASKKTGGVFADEGSGKKSVFYLSGSPRVAENSSKTCKDIYLASGVRINVIGALSGAEIVVDKSDGEGQITEGYSTYNAGINPSKYFSSAMGYEVSLVNNEASLGRNTQGETDTELPFINPGSQINTDLNSLGSTNWMSGISGERYLNEINMPATHDSSMNKIEEKWFDWSTWVPGAFSHKLAKTQEEHIYQQMNHGYRKFDLRLNPVYKKFKWIGAWYAPVPGYYWEDDGENLYMCHGKTKYGTIMALDPDDEYLTFNTVLDWTQEFLRKHPTETIILELSDELDIDYQSEKWVNETYARAGRILNKFAREINPSTGESYLYKEEEAASYLTPYTHMPQLKDCRGKVVIMSNSKHLNKTGGFTLGTVGVKSWNGQKYVISPDKKVTETEEHYKYLQESFNQSEENPLRLRTDVGEPSNYLWSFGLNVTNQEDDLEYVLRRIMPVVDCAPYEYARDVNERLFGAGKIFDSTSDTSNNKIGQYLGWISMDGAREKYATEIWRTNFNFGGNFPESVANYCTVTVDPTSVLPGYSAQTFKVVKGTTITLPDNIYKGINKYLNYWVDASDNSKIYYPGDKYTVNSDVTFKPVFLKEGEVPVSIEWHDGNNADNLRDNKIPFIVKPKDLSMPEYTITLSEDQGYRAIVKNGDNVTIIPNWDKIMRTDANPYGVDAKAQYRFEYSSSNTAGYIFKFYHTSNSTQSISGNVEWVDNGTSTRPTTVTVNLYEKDTDKYVKSVQVMPSSTGEWKYQIQEVPKFRNGERIEYVIKVDDVDNYATYIDGYNITNILKSSISTVGGYVFWDDGNNINKVRPGSVTLELYANGVLKAEKVIKLDAIKGDVEPFSFDDMPIVDSNKNKIEYTVKIKEAPIANYTTTVSTEDDGTIIVTNRYYDDDNKVFGLETYSTNDEFTTDIVEPDVSPASPDNKYAEDASITVTAQEVTGSEFLGWYKVTEVVDGQVKALGEQVSTDISYEFEITEDTKLAAKYKQEKCVFRAYSINKECKATVVMPSVNPMPGEGHMYDVDTHITATANSEYGYEFRGWYEVLDTSGDKVTSYGGLVSPNATYSFDLDKNTQIVAVYEAVLNANMKPTPKQGLIADGTSKVLVDSPIANPPDGYTLMYALGDNNKTAPSSGSFREDLPEGIDEGTYYVWFQAIGDSDHDDFPPECIQVVISSKEEPGPGPGPGPEPGGTYEDVPVITGVVRDITGTDEAPNETNPNDASIGNVDDLHFEEEDVEQGINLWVYVILIDPSKLTDEEKAKIKRESGEYTVGAYYDIRVYAKVGNDHSYLLKQTVVPVQVDFRPLASVIKDNRSYGMVRLHDGTTAFIDAVYDAINYRMSFLSDKYSTYALVYKDNEEPPVPPGPTPPGPTPPGPTPPGPTPPGPTPPGPTPPGPEPGPSPAPSGDVPSGGGSDNPLNPGDSGNATDEDSSYSGGTKVKPAKTGDDISIVYFFNLTIDSLF